MANGRYQGPGMFGPMFQAGISLLGGSTPAQAMQMMGRAQAEQQRLAQQNAQFQESLAMRKAAQDAAAARHAETLGQRRAEFAAGAPMRQARLKQLQMAQAAAERAEAQKARLLDLFGAGAGAGAQPQTAAGPDVAGGPAGPGGAEGPADMGPGGIMPGQPEVDTGRLGGFAVAPPIPPASPSARVPSYSMTAPSGKKVTRDWDAPMDEKISAIPDDTGITPAQSLSSPGSLEEQIQALSPAQRMRAINAIQGGKIDDALKIVDAASRPGGFGDAKEQFDVESKMRTEFTKNTKNFRTIADQYSVISAAGVNPSPAGDLSMIYAYMKMLDPGSVVRESEFAMAANAGSLPTRLQNLANKAIQGTFTGKTRQDFLNRARTIYNQREKVYARKERQYSRLARRKGLNPIDVITDPRLSQEMLALGGQQPGQVNQPAGSMPRSGSDQAFPRSTKYGF